MALIGAARPLDLGYWREAKAEANWLVWRPVPRGDRLDKHPADPRTGRSPISVHKAARLTFGQAEAAARAVEAEATLEHIREYLRSYLTAVWRLSRPTP